jgi:hypothetical protein
VPFLTLTVQVDPFSAVIWPMTPGAWPALGGALAVGGAGVVGMVLVGLLGPLEHAVTPVVTKAPIATVVPIRRRFQPAALFIGHSFLINCGKCVLRLRSPLWTG